jgi:bifunctional non-homologous end joining protein LigD
MSLRLHPRAFPPGVIPPCLPTAATEAPSGDGWLHEIKHDGYRVLARKDGQRIKLFSRSGNELTNRFPLIVEAMAKLRSHSCIIDGEAVACGPDGIGCFELSRGWYIEASVFMWAFDLIELDGQDMRHNPLETQKASLECLLSRAAPGIAFNQHITSDGTIIFQHACRLGLEGIVSKRKDSRYTSGRSLHWIKSNRTRRL